uniref:Mannosyltransferase PIG-V n=1 Tax=Vitiosangium cumulatum TaxID=1867796 RepID=A0A7D4XGR4_9BACT|nr:hypothetical protein [Vitiosangium cumulatum]
MVTSLRRQWASIRAWLVGDTSWRGDLARALLLYLVTRVALGLFVWLVQQHEFCHGPRCLDNRVFPENRFLNGLFQWDAIHYYRVITRGYFVGSGYDTTAPFFPGFPLAARWMGALVGSPLLGGILVNHLASLLAAFLMARLVRALSIGGVTPGREGADERAGVDAVAREATLFWLGAPLTFFFTVFLSEAVFGLASVAAFWAVARGRWPLALVAGIAASATRNAGLIVCVCALLLAWERRRIVPVPRYGWLCVALGPLGLGLFILYQHVALGDGFAWVHAQAAWNRGLVFPWKTFQDDWIGLPGVRGHAVDAMYRTQEVLALAVLLPFLFLRRQLGIPWAIWLLGVGEWLLPLASHSLISCARYQAGNLYFALAIPAFLAPRPTTRGVAWMLFGMVLAYYATMYPVGNWAS